MKSTVTVLTCNLFFGRADEHGLLQIIDDHDVDVVCAQELSPRLAAAIRARLPHGTMDHDQVAGGNGIASRHPVDIARIAMQKRDGWVATLAPPHWPALETATQIVNVHLSAPHLWPYFPNPVRRSHQLRALLQERERADGMAFAIVGDFNATPGWPLYRRLAERYCDGVHQAMNGQDPAPTWPHVPGWGLRGLFRIDHCFVHRLRVVATRTLAIAGSDHLGVLVELAPAAAGDGS